MFVRSSINHLTKYNRFVQVKVSDKYNYRCSSITSYNNNIDTNYKYTNHQHYSIQVSVSDGTRLMSTASISNIYGWNQQNVHQLDNNSSSKRRPVLVVRPFSTKDGTTTTTPTTDTTTTPKVAVPLEIVLYQYKICPFCNRVKAVLDYMNISYKSIEVNPLTKKEIKQFKNQYTKVPIVTIVGQENEPIFGSDEIIQRLVQNPTVQQQLQQRWNTNNDNDADTSNSKTTMTMELFLAEPSTTTTSPDKKNWSLFATNDIASLLYPNICRTVSDSYTAFRYVHNVPKFSLIQQYTIRSIGSLAMYFAASKVKKRLGIKDERKALEDALQTFETEGLLASLSTTTNDDNDHDDHGVVYLSGSTIEPNIHDLSMYGVLRSIEGLPIHTEIIVKRPTSPLTLWYKQMKKHVNRYNTYSVFFVSADEGRR